MTNDGRTLTRISYAMGRRRPDSLSTGTPQVVRMRQSDNPLVHCALLLTTQRSPSAIYFCLGNFASANQRGDTGIGQPVSVSTHTVF
jgi:hypothetical protein